MSLLAVDSLSVEYKSDLGVHRALQDVSLKVDAGEVVGIVGESGCGKSTLVRTILRLLPKSARVVSGEIRFDGADLLALPLADLRKLRWSRLAAVFQGSMNVLNPVFTVERQIGEAIREHRPRTSRRSLREEVGKQLERVGIGRERASAFPHELSGGQRQRVGIAMALALNPELIIADEPTTALDVVTQDEVMAELLDKQRGEGFSLLVVSHDMGVIAEACDRVAVMYAGEIVEVGPTTTVFSSSAHPYTMGLINAIRSVGDERPPVSIPGRPPASFSSSGCRFADRCPFVRDDCLVTSPDLLPVSPNHLSRCLFAADRQEFAVRASDPRTWTESRRDN